MCKMGLHDPFEYLQNKLWLEKKSGVKVSIWFHTTKSQELPSITSVQVACHISLEIFQWRLQLCLKPCFNRRYEKEVMGLQSGKSPNFKKFGTPNLGVPKKWHLGQPLWLVINNIIKGKVVASPKSKSWWVLWICVCPWFVHAPKVLQLCINQLVVWFV
jgi:hypothetical protein